MIEGTHVKYLESAGARVVPIDWTQTQEHIEDLLSKVNGLYIPGDSSALLDGTNQDFTKVVRKCLKWA